MIDWTRVQDLCAEVGEEDLEDVVDLFLEEVEMMLAMLDKSSDALKLAENLHFLKGSALNMGFIEFAEVCAHGEKTANAGNINDFDLSKVNTAYKNAKAFFLQNWRESLAA